MFGVDDGIGNGIENGIPVDIDNKDDVGFEDDMIVDKRFDQKLLDVEINCINTMNTARNNKLVKYEDKVNIHNDDSMGRNNLANNGIILTKTNNDFDNDVSDILRMNKSSHDG